MKGLGLRAMEKIQGTVMERGGKEWLLGWPSCGTRDGLAHKSGFVFFSLRLNVLHISFCVTHGNSPKGKVCAPPFPRPQHSLFVTKFLCVFSL